MVKQFITNPDGSLPAGVSLAKLQAAGISLVRPTEPPRQAGKIAVELEPELVDGVLYQRWELADPQPVVLSPDEQQKLMTDLVQTHLDMAAQARGYDNILSAASYAGDPIFGVEGDAYKAWRSAVWEHCYSVLADVKSGTRPVPTAEELLAELPVLGL